MSKEVWEVDLRSRKTGGFADLYATYTPHGIGKYQEEKEFLLNYERRFKMDIGKKMIDFVLNKANDEQIKEFFGYAPHGFSREDIEDNLSQMPDDVFDELVKEFRLSTDGVKL